MNSAFDRLTELAAALFQAPIALVTSLETDRQWFRSRRGYGEDQTTFDESFCRHMVGEAAGSVMVVEDAALDARFAANRLVTEKGVRFYAGAVITTANGGQDGAVCVLDTVARDQPTISQMECLKLLARLAGQEIDRSREASALQIAERGRSELIQTLGMAEELAKVGSWRLDAQTGAVQWSAEVYRIHGLDPKAFDPALDDALAFYHPDDRDAVRNWCTRAIETGECGGFQFRLIRSDGEERLVISQCRPEYDDTGATTALFGVFQDVTDSVRANEVVAASEARYRLLADNSTDVIITVGLDGRFEYVSPAVIGPMGYRPDELVGRPFAQFMHPEDVPLIQGAFEALVQSEVGSPSTRVPYRAIRKDGSQVWLEAHPTAVRNPSGRVTGFQDVVRDITDRKALEAELIAARDVAEAGARAKSDFLANMSHELRTPLTSVIGFSGLLRASAHLPTAERVYAERIATASEALLSVINDILDYSKLEADAVDLDPRPFDPRALGEGAAAIIEGQCQTKGLTLTVDVAGNLPSLLMGDEGRVRQVLLNFLSNAVKFTASGDICLTLAEQGGRLRVEVRDSGIGIAPEKLDQLFDRFTQADASTTRVYGGTGLGLAISRRLIEMMGGEIGAESAPGGGSTFWFTIPMHAVYEEAARSAPTDTTIPPGLRVLMADDAAANRELVTVILKSLGVKLDTVCDGAEAVEATRSGQYDLVLMDVHMPIMDGLSATRAIRASGGEAAETPIIALTANVQPEQMQRCREAGMDGHVGKPIHVHELVAVMNTVLAHGGTASRATAA